MTKLLLDTNTWLWMSSDSKRLGPQTRELIEADDTELVLSAVSAWEMSIKWALGKLALPMPPEQFVEATVSAGDLTRLPIEFAHVTRVASLPRLHADPFDRLLIAQSQITGLAVLTGDSMMSSYGIATVDAAR